MSDSLDRLLSPFLGERLTRALPKTGSRGDAKSQADVEEASNLEGGLSFAFKFIRQDKAALAGLIIVGLFLGWALVEGIMQEVATLTKDQAYGWLLLPSDPLKLNFNNVLTPPSFKNLASLLGTDDNGHSILSQILYAAPHDATAAILVVGSAILIGTFVGIPAGYYGGWVDEVLMRLTDAFLAFPFLVLAIAFTIILGNGFTVVLAVLMLIWWPTYARYFRAQTLALRNRGFVEASKLNGVSSWTMMFRHIFPNAIDPVIAQATLDFGTVIVTYSTLAFLGIGLDVGYPEWGAMTSNGLNYLQSSAYFALIPGAVIIIIVVAFTLIGDRLQDLVGGRITY